LNLWTTTCCPFHNFVRWATVGEFRKTRHPRNVEFNEVLEICFSGARHLRFSGISNLWSLRVANMRFSGISNLRSLRVANMRFSGISNLRSLGVVNVRKPGISNWWSHEFRRMANSRICQKSSSEVTSGEIHEPVRSKVKVVAPKSPGLECELVAGL
jgi:hypothetical protein